MANQPSNAQISERSLMDAADFTQGTVVITGASKGIGAAIARQFSLKTSFKLLLVARSEEGLRKTSEFCNEQGVATSMCCADLTTDEGIASVASCLEGERLSGIVHNMGVYTPGTLSDTSYSDISEAMRCNVFPAFALNQIVIPLLKHEKRGFLFHVGSVAAYEAIPRAVAYGISKHALTGYVKSLRAELCDHGIAVSVIHPGNTWSSAWENSGVDKKRIIDPDDIGKLLATTALMEAQTVVEEMIVSPIRGNFS